MKKSITKYGNNKIYKIHFSNLTDLYYYLKSEPKVNNIFCGYQSSMSDDVEFNGESLKKAIEYCKGGYCEKDNDFSIFFNISNNMRKLIDTGIYDRKLERGLYGGIALPSLVASGIPACMLRYSYDKNVKHVTIYFQLGYSAITNYKQIFNRGIAVINLINALEANGYIVNLKTFELSQEYDEIIDISVELKGVTERINVSKCYYPFVSKEFLRRILFRVLESMPVNSGMWVHSYGRPVESNLISKIYNLSNNDIVIPTPYEIGIEGEDIYEDTIRLIEYLNLQDEIDITKIKHKCNQKLKVKPHKIL